MRKPKLTKLPKKPKASASVDAVKRYIERKKEVERENKRKLSEYLKVKKQLERI